MRTPAWCGAYTAPGEPRAPLPRTRLVSIPGSDVRLITIGSDSYKWQHKLRAASVEELSGHPAGDSFNARIQRYSISKLVQILWLRELQARLDADGVAITCTVANPGAVYTEGARSGSSKLPWPLSKIADGVLYATSASPEDAAFIAVWAATTLERATIRDAYVSRKGRNKAVVDKWAGLALDEPLRKQLWETSERFVADRLAQSDPEGAAAS